MNSEKARVLIVDDDREVREVLCDFLNRSHCCLALESADKALAILASQPFDLVISDISMARMTGLEMLPHIRKIAPDSVVVMISGQLTIEFAIAAMRAGAFDYVTKPFGLPEVDAVVRRALDHGRRLQQARLAEMGSEVRAREMREALEREEFVVHYQPQVDIETRKIVGAEALVRWQYRRGDLLLPADFIPLAEINGFIVPIGESVLRVACAQAREWHKAGSTGLRIAVNVSPQQLHTPNFPDRVSQILEDSALSAEFLEIEVTESTIIRDAECGIQTLSALREMGVRIAIDDFGTGYSSLSYLKRLPIDSLKLDASFVKDATTEPDDAALVMAIITLAHNLKLRVIAEGIETEDQLAFLRLLRCNEGQGYLFGKPLSANEVTSSLGVCANHRNEESIRTSSY